MGSSIGIFHHCSRFSDALWQFSQSREKTMFWLLLWVIVMDFSHLCTTWASKERLLPSCSFSSLNESIFAYQVMRARVHICIGSTDNCTSISVVSLYSLVFEITYITHQLTD